MVLSVILFRLFPCLSSSLSGVLMNYCLHMNLHLWETVFVSAPLESSEGMCVLCL